MEGVPHNLPLQPTSFVGRGNEIVEITGLLADPHCRLLTLVGPGGIGKTRLALEVAHGFVRPEVRTTTSMIYPDGVYLVALQPVASTEDIVTSIASAVGFEFYQAQDSRTQLLNYLAKRRSLVILDNFEHLLTAIDLIEELLDKAPHLELMVTSRAAVNLAQEWLYHVEGMAYPLDKAPDRLESYSAVQLFLERARQVRHDFSMEDEGAQVTQICQLVDGMPLGIEMAASWLRRLPCGEIVVEIQRSLDILETDLIGLPDRHRSMRAVLGHSWKLLGREEREALMKLSIFRGGFRREAAEYVTGASLQTLSALVDHSHLRLANTGRYEMHELQRQYAAERLAERPELEITVRDRHCTYFAHLMDQPVRNLVDTRSKEAKQALEADIDNLRSAWNWAVEHTRIRDMHQCMETMFWFSLFFSWSQEGERAFRQAVAVLRETKPGQERDVALGIALSFLGWFETEQGRTLQSQENVQEGISILRCHNARRELAQATMSSAVVAVNFRENPEEARALGLEAVALLEETGQNEFLGFTLNLLGWLAQSCGQYTESERWYDRALYLGKKTGDQWTVANSLMHLGSRTRAIGEYERADHLLQESLALSREHRYLEITILTLTILGRVYEATGEIEKAKTYLHEGLATARDRGQGIRIAHCSVVLGHFLAAQREVERAAKLYQEALDIIPQSGSVEYRLQALTGLGWLAFQSREYGQARRYHEESMVLSRRIRDHRYTIHNLNGLGRIALAQGDHVLAGRHFLAAVKEGLAIGAPPVVLDSLTDAGELFSQEGDPALGTRLTTLVLNHPAIHATTKKRAERLLERLETKMPAEGFAIACERGILDALEPTAEEIAEQLVYVVGQVAPTAAAFGHQPPLDRLSDRELEILRLVALGSSNREIAAELTLALGTVKSHLHHIFQKLGVSSRMQAVSRSRDLHLL